MSRHKAKARDRTTLKNTRDGLVERNETTGEDTRLSKREADLDLRGGTPERETFSQVGKRQATQGAGKRSQQASPDFSPEQSALKFTERQQAAEHPAQTDTLPDNAYVVEAPQSSSLSGDRRVPLNQQGEKVHPTTLKARQYKQAAKQQNTQMDSPAAPNQTNRTADIAPQPKSVKPESIQDATALKTDKSGKLRFMPDEAMTDTTKAHHNRKLIKAQAQAERITSKLEKARDKLPAIKKLRMVSVTDTKTGDVKRKLQFEKMPISQGEHIKGPLPLRPVKAAGNSALVYGHRKLYQVEHENVGVKAAHRSEMVAEGGVRSALRFHKTAPYRKVAKLERKSAKKSINLTYRQLLDHNPKLKSNIITRALQKRKIKKDYAKAAREAQKAAKKAKKVGSAAVDISKAVVGVVKRHPIASTVVILIAFLIFSITSFIGAFGSMGSGGLGSIAASTYLAEDTEIFAAEAAYAGMEADLQNELDNYAALHPGYDEYRFDLDTIWHDPYVLTSILSALHDGAWTVGDVQGTLATLFEQQYILTEAVTTETRYRKETTDEIDPETGEAVETLVPYDYYICTVALENFSLSHLPIYIMGEDRLSRYALFTATLGNRPDLFPVSAYPNASFYKDYGRHDIPQEYFNDATFAAMIKEAEKWLGMPYVWGGYSPKTSFDCSGFVSWVLNNSGWDIGRLSAQGLYNISALVSASDARPGDLIFFHSTYKGPGVTHVGIYVGDGMMLHCGNPIGYASINTAYWQQHFYAYGRVY